MRLTADAIAAATGARVIPVADSGRASSSEPFDSVAIDSRKVRPGALFFALRGPNHDGHDFIPAALAAGARGIVISRENAGAGDSHTLVTFLVPETTRALQDLAASVRRRLSLVVGITGSAGKTTAKEMTAAVLSRGRPTGRSPGNLNNLFGLPLSLLELPEDAEAAVLEMGMSYPGEIARLVEIADPDIGVLLNVREVHLGHFSSIDAIAEAKGELFRGMRREATAVWNAADPRVARLAALHPGPKASFAIDAPADLVARDVEDDIVRGARFRLLARGERRDVRLSLFGRHNVENALCALTVAAVLGDDLDEAIRALALVRAAAMRGEVLRLGGGIVLVDDTYNSNPSAMASVLASLAATSWTGRKVLACGDMLELGPRSAEFHGQVGEQAARMGIGLLIAVGPMSSATVAGAARLGLQALSSQPDSDAAGAAAGSLLAPGDLVVVKGSRGIAMERFVAAARAAFGEGRG